MRTVTGGRYQTRTDDLFRVKEARYQLRQSPVALRAESRSYRMLRARATVRARDTRAPRLVWRVRIHRLKSFKRPEQSGKRGCSAVGSAQPCQGWGREFESRHPLECRGSSFEDRSTWGQTTRWRGRAARHRPAKPFTRVRIPSLARIGMWGGRRDALCRHDRRRAIRR